MEDKVALAQLIYSRPAEKESQVCHLQEPSVDTILQEIFTKDGVGHADRKREEEALARVRSQYLPRGVPSAFLGHAFNYPYQCPGT